MLFDWFTIGAQTLNFLILVWLMKRFLYKPILDAIDAREKRIATALADAAAKQTEAQKERDKYQQKTGAFDLQRNDLLAKAREEIKAERQRLLDEARQAADALGVKRRDALTSELRSLRQDIAHQSQQEVFAIAQKVLSDLAGTSLEERMIEVFTQRLRDLDSEARAGLAKALKSSGNTALVRSAFELPTARRDALQQALSEVFLPGIQISYETRPDVIGGIELSANGWKLAWNIADFLASMEQGIDDLLNKQAEPDNLPNTPVAAS